MTNSGSKSSTRRTSLLTLLLNRVYNLNVSFNAGFRYVFQGGHSRPQCLRVWEYARKLWETLRRSSQNLAIWASQRMLFDAAKTFCFFYICFIAKVLCCFGIRTEEIQLTALKNFQVSKALCGSCWENTVKPSQSQIWDLKFAYAWQLILKIFQWTTSRGGKWNPNGLLR